MKRTISCINGGAPAGAGAEPSAEAESSKRQKQRLDNSVIKRKIRDDIINDDVIPRFTRGANVYVSSVLWEGSFIYNEFHDTPLAPNPVEMKIERVWWRARPKQYWYDLSVSDERFSEETEIYEMKEPYLLWLMDLCVNIPETPVPQQVRPATPVTNASAPNIAGMVHSAVQKATSEIVIREVQSIKNMIIELNGNISGLSMDNKSWRDTIVKQSRDTQLILQNHLRSAPGPGPAQACTPAQSPRNAPHPRNGSGSGTPRPTISRPAGANAPLIMRPRSTSLPIAMSFNEEQTQPVPQATYASHGDVDTYADADSDADAESDPDVATVDGHPPPPPEHASQVETNPAPVTTTAGMRNASSNRSVSFKCVSALCENETKWVHINHAAPQQYRSLDPASALRRMKEMHGLCSECKKSTQKGEHMINIKGTMSLCVFCRFRDAVNNNLCKQCNSKDSNKNVDEAIMENMLKTLVPLFSDHDFSFSRNQGITGSNGSTYRPDFVINFNISQHFYRIIIEVDDGGQHHSLSNALQEAEKTCAQMDESMLELEKKSRTQHSGKVFHIRVNTKNVGRGKIPSEDDSLRNPVAIAEHSGRKQPPFPIGDDKVVLRALYTRSIIVWYVRNATSSAVPDMCELILFKPYDLTNKLCEIVKTRPLPNGAAPCDRRMPHHTVYTNPALDLAKFVDPSPDNWTCAWWPIEAMYASANGQSSTVAGGQRTNPFSKLFNGD